MACKKNNVDFSYAPTDPRAGETVKFSNLSSSGEEWEWTFGDGATATIKSPSHTYKQPGTYRVMLKVDKRAAWTKTKEITVYDTIPTFVCADSVFSIYNDYTFEANIYNPYNYEVSYLWVLPLDMDYFTPTDEDLTSSTLKGYFTRPLHEAPIWLCIVMNGDTTYVEKSFEVQDRATNSVLLRTTEGDFRQRIFGARAEEAKVITKSALLDAEQDTVQTYNGHTFTLDEVASVFPGVQGFHISNRKIYYRADGLWVANIDGANPVQIDASDCPAMTLDTKDNRIYWANAEGVWYMPFVGSDNNKFVTVPVLLNDMKNVNKIAADAEEK